MLNLIGNINKFGGTNGDILSMEKILFSADVKFNLISLNDSDLLGKTSEFPTNIWCIPPNEIPIVYSKYGIKPFKNKRNILYGPWEFPKLPPEALFLDSLISEFWAPTTFVHNAYKDMFKDKAYFVGRFVDIEELSKFSSIKEKQNRLKKSLDIRYALDALSNFNRKNLKGLNSIADELSKSYSKDQIQINLKIANLKKLPIENENTIRSIVSNPLINLHLEDLSRQETLEFIANADLYISPHRSEGFGLTIAEAMCMRVPVLCSRYSGNLDFTNDETAHLIDGKEIECTREDYLWAGKNKWFDPSPGKAATIISNCFNRKDYMNAKVDAALLTMKEKHTILSVFNKIKYRL